MPSAGKLTALLSLTAWSQARAQAGYQRPACAQGQSQSLGERQNPGERQLQTLIQAGLQLALVQAAGDRQA